MSDLISRKNIQSELINMRSGLESDGWNEAVISIQYFVKRQPAVELERTAQVYTRLPIGKEKTHQRCCGNCNHKGIAWGHKFCTECGYRLNQKEEPNE